MKITPALNGFLKGLFLTVAAAAVAYLANPENLTFMSASAALVVSGIASAIESSIKAKTGNGLFGAVRVG